MTTTISKANSLYTNGVQPAFPTFTKSAIDWKTPTNYQAAFSNTYLGEVTASQRRHVDGSRTVKGADLTLRPL